MKDRAPTRSCFTVALHPRFHPDIGRGHVEDADYLVAVRLEIHDRNHSSWCKRRVRGPEVTGEWAVVRKYVLYDNLGAAAVAPDLALDG